MRFRACVPSLSLFGGAHENQVNAAATGSEQDAVMRLSITFEGQAEERLKKLAVNGSSKADVLRRALALEEAFVDAQRDGATFYLKKKNGQIEKLVRV
jgi:hypothetical protein